MRHWTTAELKGTTGDVGVRGERLGGSTVLRSGVCGQISGPDYETCRMKSYAVGVGRGGCERCASEQALAHGFHVFPVELAEVRRMQGAGTPDGDALECYGEERHGGTFEQGDLRHGGAQIFPLCGNEVFERCVLFGEEHGGSCYNGIELRLFVAEPRDNVAP